MESWTNGEGQVVSTMPTEGGTIQLSPKGLDINLAKSGDDYQVTLPADLQKLQAFVNAGFDCAGKSFKQTQDIDMAALEWTGIGAKQNSTDKCFSGTYDGCNHAILNVSFTGMKYQGFFNSVKNATFKNLTIDVDAVINAPGDGDEFGLGAFVGYAYTAATFNNCVATGSVTENLNHNGAGFVNGAGASLTFLNCTNKLNIVSTGEKVGGFYAINTAGPATQTFTNCKNEGNLTAGDSGNATASAFIGYLTNQKSNTVNFENCENTGTLTSGAKDCGVFVGYFNAGTIVNVAGNKAQASYKPVGVFADSAANQEVNGFTYATVAGGVATYVADAALAKDTPYTLKMPITSDAAIFELETAGDTFILNTNGLAFAGTVVAKDETLVVTPEVKDTTITWTAAAAQTEPIPPVNPSATPAEVNEAVDAANFADTTVKAMIDGDATKYTAFKTWAGTVTGGEEAVVASTLAAKSFEMSSVAEAHLFENEPEIKITETTVGDSWTATVAIKDGVVPVAAIKAIEDQVQVTTTIETANSWGKATATAVIGEDGIATITITKPGDTKGFMRVKAAK